MLESYRVGITMTLGGDVSSGLARIAAQMREIQEIAKQTSAAIGAMGKFASSMGGINVAAAAMSKAAADMTSAMPNVTRQAEATASAMERAASASRALVPYQGGGALVPYWNGNTGHTQIGGPYTPYGYSPALPGPRSSGGALVPWVGPTGFTMGPGGTGWSAGTPLPTPPGWGTYGPPATGGGAMAPFAGGGGRGNGLPPLMFGGGGSPLGPRPGQHDFMLAAAGYGVVGHTLTGFVGDVFKATANVGHQQYMLRAMGWAEEDIKRATAAAESAQKNILGVTVAGALEAQRDIFTITRDKDKSINLAPDLLRSSVVLAASGKGTHLQQLFQALQAGELRGVITPDKIPNFLRMVEATSITTGGRAGPAEILQFLRSSGVAGRTLAEPELFGQFIPEILSMGAARAGTGLQAFFQQFGTGRMSDATVGHFLGQMGLIQDASKFMKAGIGQWQSFPGGLKGEQLVYAGNEAQFMREVLLPAIDAYNVRNFGKTDPLLQARTGSAMSSRIPGGRFLAEYFTLLPLSQQYEEAIKSGSSRNAYNMRSDTDPQLKLLGLQSAWNGFLVSMGNNPAMDAAIRTLRDLTEVLNTMSKVAKDHPNTAARVIEGAGVVGAVGIGAAVVSGAMWLGRPMVRVGRYMIDAARAGAAGVGGAVGGTAAGTAARSVMGRAAPPLAVGAALWDVDAGWASNHYWSPFDPLAITDARGNRATPWHRSFTPADHRAAGGAPSAASSSSWLSDLAKKITDGLAAVASAEAARPVNMTGRIVLDGKAIGDFVGTAAGRAANLPSNGPSGPDTRSSPAVNTDTPW